MDYLIICLTSLVCKNVVGAPHKRYDKVALTAVSWLQSRTWSHKCSSSEDVKGYNAGPFKSERTCLTGRPSTELVEKILLQYPDDLVEGFLEDISPGIVVKITEGFPAADHWLYICMSVKNETGQSPEDDAP